MPRPVADRPYPFAPVQALMDLYGVSDSQLGIWTGSTTVPQARRKVQRWKVAGLTEAQADAVAARLHMHPAEVWTDYWWTLVRQSESEGASDVQGDRPITDPEPDVVGERAAPRWRCV